MIGSIKSRWRRSATCATGIGLCVLSACNQSSAQVDDDVESNMATIYVPEENDTYAPRDIQARIELGSNYLDSIEPQLEDGVGNRLIIDVTLNDMRPANDLEGPANGKISISIVRKDYIRRLFDPSHPDYSGYSFSDDRPVLDDMYGLSRQTNHRWGNGARPVDELFILRDGDWDLYIECHDPSPGRPVGCGMHIIYSDMRSPDDASFWTLGASVFFRRERAKDWRSIRSRLDEFVSDRVSLVPFEHRSVEAN